MLKLLPNGRTAQLTGDVYAVVRHGSKYEVRCWEFRDGDKVRDDLVDVFDFESVAHTVAGALAEGDEHDR